MIDKENNKIKLTKKGELMNSVSLEFRPYLISTFYNWCINNNQQPMIEAINTSKNNVPYCNIGEPVIFNIHPLAVRDIQFGLTTLSFIATFNGISNKIELFYESFTEIFTKDDSNSIEMEEIINISKVLNRIK